MLKGNLKHISYYTYLSPEIRLCLKYLADTDFSVLNGRYDIVEDKIYANVQDYTSKFEAEGKFEAHKKYIDIQFVVKGKEKIGIGDIEDFKEIIPYDENKDIAFLEPVSETKTEFVTLKENEFVILAPNNVHMPSIAVDEPEYVKKVVIKVLFQ